MPLRFVAAAFEIDSRTRSIFFRCARSILSKTTVSALYMSLEVCKITYQLRLKLNDTYCCFP